MSSMFKKATKAKAKLRMAISGPSGSGKTMTALLLAKHLGKRVALIDTERGSASKYAGDVAEFDATELDLFTVENYMRAINGAAAEGYDVLVIDSLSHAWSGRGGILEQVEKAGGKFSAWAKFTPLQQRFIDTILSYPGHVIATMRSKTAYEVSVEEGKNGTKQTRVEKLGLAPVQRDDVSFEFDVMLDMNDRNVASVVKTRCSAISGQYIDKPGKELADTLLAWLSDGVEMQPAKPAEAEPPATQTEKPYTFDQHLKNLERIGPEKLQAWVTRLFEMNRTKEQGDMAWTCFVAKCALEGKDPESYLPPREDVA